MADNLPDVYIKFTDAEPDIRGESMDSIYEAAKGWLGIQSFNFGFGWGGSASGQGEMASLRRQLALEEDKDKRNSLARRMEELEKKAGPGGKGTKGNGKSNGNAKEEKGQLQQKEFRFTKSPGVSSKDILLNLQKGPEKGLSAELIVCRSSGGDAALKIPFLKFSFTKVQFTKCSMSISKDNPVSEDVEFWFDQVTMETIWTDNETGKTESGSKNSISFDFGNKDSDPEFKEFLDNNEN